MNMNELFPRYQTDGRIIEDVIDGGCMGIFSAITMLNEKDEQNRVMKKALEEMADEDFRGNRNHLSVKAFQTLKELGFRS